MATNENRKNFIKRHKEMGLCIECTNKVEKGHTRCQECLKRKADWTSKKRKEAIAQGLCRYCLKESASMRSQLCKKCYLKDTSSRHFGTTKYWVNLQRLFEKQKEQCACSGVSLVLGENTELDHIIPTSTNGENSLNNVQWVLDKVNRIKNNMTQDEFVDLVTKIYNWSLR